MEREQFEILRELWGETLNLPLDGALNKTARAKFIKLFAKAKQESPHPTTLNELNAASHLINEAVGANRINPKQLPIVAKSLGFAGEDSLKCEVLRRLNTRGQKLVPVPSSTQLAEPACILINEIFVVLRRAAAIRCSVAFEDIRACCRLLREREADGQLVLRPIAFSTNIEKSDLKKDVETSRPEYVIARSVREGKPIVGDVTKVVYRPNDPLREDVPLLKSVLAFPLTLNNQIIGVISLDSLATIRSLKWAEPGRGSIFIEPKMRLLMDHTVSLVEKLIEQLATKQK